MAQRLAIDIGGTKLALGAVSERGEISERLLVETPRDGSGGKLGAAALLSWLRGQAREFWSSHSISPPGLVGVSSPGIISPDRQSALWGDLPRGERLLEWERAISEEFPDAEFQLLNDGNAFAWGEYHYGASSAVGRSHPVGRVLDWGSGEPRGVEEAAELLAPPSRETAAESLICVCIGTGIGAGIILDGEIWEGRYGGAGEFGQLRAQALSGAAGGRPASEPPAGELWPRLTLSDAADGEAIAESYAALVGADPPQSALAGARWVAHAASQGETRASKVLAAAGERVAAALADVTVALAPDRIVVGGGAGPALFPVILAKLRSELQETFVSTRLSRSSLGADAHLLGAVTPR